MRHFVGLFFVAVVASLVLMVVLALLMQGCRPAVDPTLVVARKVNVSAARLLNEATAEELARINLLVHDGVAPCEKVLDLHEARTCRETVIDAVMTRETPRLEQLERMVTTQHLLDDSLTVVEACEAQASVSDTPLDCTSTTHAQLAAALPDVVAMIELLKPKPAASAAPSGSR